MASSNPAPGMTRQRLARKLALGLLGLLGCALLVVVMLPYIISLDGVKGQIIAQIEGALQRKVDIGAVRLQLLSGLGAGLEDVIIYNPPGWQQPYFLKAGTLSVKIAWRPLLRRHVVITQMLLRDGGIIIERDAEGRMNVADLAVAQPGPVTTLPAQGDRLPSGSAPPASNPLAGLLISDVTLQNMPITFVDHMAVPGQEIITVASNFQLHVQDVALGTPIPIDMRATMLTDGGQNIRLRGRIGPIPESLAVESVPIDVHLQIIDVRLDKLTPYVGAHFPLMQGRLGGDVTVEGSIDKSLRLHGTLSLADAALREGIMPDASSALPTLTSTQDITVDLPTGRAELTDAEINVSSLQATIKGTVYHFTTTPQLDLRLATNRFIPGALLTEFPRLGALLPTPTDLRGTAQLQSTVTGALHDLRSETQIDLQDITLRSGSFNGGAEASGGVLLETDKTDARLVTQTVNADPPLVHIDVRTQRLIFDQQGPHGPAPTQDRPPEPTAQTSPSQAMLPPVTLSGNVSIAEGRLKHLNFQQMTADFNLLKELLTTSQQMKLYSGSYQGTMQVNLTPSEPSYTLDAKVAGLAIGQAINDLTPANNVLLGVLDTDMRLAGQGFDWDAITKTLSGDGHVKIAEAQLTTFDLMPQLVQVLRNVGGLVGLTIPSGWEPGAVRAIEGDWHLRQGKILTDHLRLRGEGIEALLEGYIGLDQSIDYVGTFFLPAKFVARQGAPTILRQDDAGRLIVPFTVQGTVTAPRMSFDEKALVGSAQEEIVDKMRKQLGDKLEGLLGKPSARDQQRQESDKAGQDTEGQPKRQNSPAKMLRELLRR